jgi:hypothetical protein
MLTESFYYAANENQVSERTNERASERTNEGDSCKRTYVSLNSYAEASLSYTFYRLTDVSFTSNRLTAIIFSLFFSSTTPSSSSSLVLSVLSTNMCTCKCNKKKIYKEEMNIEVTRGFSFFVFSFFLVFFSSVSLLLVICNGCVGREVCMLAKKEER